MTIHARSAHDDSLQWLGAHLAVGDEICIQVVELEQAAELGPVGCSFCGRDIHDVHSIVSRREVNICEGCVAGFATSLTHRSQLPLGAAIRDEADWRCGFCEKQPGEIPGVVVRNGAAICAECLRACSDMLSDPSAVLDLCVDDVVWMRPGEETLQGKVAIRAWLGQPTDGIDDLRLTNVRIDGDGDTAYKTADYRTRYAPDGSMQPVSVAGSHVWVLRRVDGSWRVVLVAWTFLSNNSS